MIISNIQKQNNKIINPKVVRTFLIGIVISTYYLRVFRFMKYKSKTNIIGQFGNTQIPMAYCNRCIVIDNKLQCCDRMVENVQYESYQSICESVHKRKIPITVKKRILEEQGYCCAYCDSSLDSIRYRNEKPVKLRTHFDHQVPYSFRNNNNEENLVASCHVCNHIKSNKMFQTMDEARMHLYEKRKSKGYDF